MYARSHVSAQIYVCGLHAHVCTCLGEQAYEGGEQKLGFSVSTLFIVGSLIEP